MPPPLFTHVSSQRSAASHDGLVKQAEAAAQHLLWRQSPHAVPFVGQGNAPQIPALHCPVQHCAEEVHGLPSDAQVESPQRPCALQGPVQHGCSGLQVWPSATQVVGAHTPFVHVPSQQRGPSEPHG
jgi:hypothetical protein